jgi:hypothetical protein
MKSPWIPARATGWLLDYLSYNYCRVCGTEEYISMYPIQIQNTSLLSRARAVDILCGNCRWWGRLHGVW